ncbi:MAG: TorA maturation chaperone TorD [Desulforhopalus sp.]|jgi:TorA maturation chaperone TorD
MNEMSDNELVRIRLRFIDLVKSFFVKEPDSEKMSRWRGTFSALSKEQVSPRFDSAVQEIARALSEKTLKEIQTEYYYLFTDPFEGAQIESNASFYFNGRSYGEALVDMRALMDEAGLVKIEEVSEQEDSLVVMLDTFASLVQEEQAGATPKIKELQARLLEEFLEPFVEKFATQLKENKQCDFYYLCCRVLGGYLDLEKSLVVSV